MELPDRRITLTLDADQLRAIEHGISTELRELAQQLRTKERDRLQSSLWDMRKQIDKLLLEKIDAFRAYDEEYQRQQGNTKHK